MTAIITQDGVVDGGDDGVGVMTASGPVYIDPEGPPVVLAKSYIVTSASDGKVHTRPGRWADLDPFDVSVDTGEFQIRDTEGVWGDWQSDSIGIEGNFYAGFSLADVEGQAAGSRVESDEAQISSQGHLIKVRRTASATPGATVSLIVTAGGTTETWNIKTFEDVVVPVYDWDPVPDPLPVGGKKHRIAWNVSEWSATGPTATVPDGAATPVAPGDTIILEGNPDRGYSRQYVWIQNLKGGTAALPVIIRNDHLATSPITIENWTGSEENNNQLFMVENLHNLWSSGATSYVEGTHCCQHVIIDGATKWVGAAADSPTRGIIVRASWIQFRVNVPATWPTAGAVYRFDGKDYTVRSVDTVNRRIWCSMALGEFGGAMNAPALDTADTDLNKQSGTGTTVIALNVTAGDPRPWTIDSPSHGLRLQSLPRHIRARYIHFDGGWDHGDFGNALPADAGGPDLIVKKGGLGIAIKVGDDKTKWRALTFSSTPTAGFPFSEFVSTGLSFEGNLFTNIHSEPMYLGCNIGDWYTVPVANQKVWNSKVWWSGYDAINWKFSFYQADEDPCEVHDNEIWYAGHMYYTATDADAPGTAANEENLHLQTNGIQLGQITHPMNVYNNIVVNTGFIGMQVFNKPSVDRTLTGMPPLQYVDFKVYNNVFARTSEHYGKYGQEDGDGMRFGSSTGGNFNGTQRTAVKLRVFAYNNTIIGSGIALSADPPLTTPEPHTNIGINVQNSCEPGSIGANNLVCQTNPTTVTGGDADGVKFAVGSSSGTVYDTNPADILFVNYTSNDPDVFDCSLQALSPALAAGVGTYAADDPWRTDAAGNTRPSTGHDVGAYERA